VSPAHDDAHDDGDDSHGERDGVRDDERPVTAGQAVTNPERKAGQQHPEVPQGQIGGRAPNDHSTDLQDGRQRHDYAPAPCRETKNRSQRSLTSDVSGARLVSRADLGRER
jgi:hypothetical protein